MLRNIIIGGVVLLGALVLVIAMRPDEFAVSRSTSIKAPPEAIFPWVNELKRWEAWSPYDKMDPDMKRTYEGPAAGEGASFSWTGNSQVGEGRTTIVSTEPSTRIGIKLEMIQPMSAVNDVEFLFKPEQAGTSVTWAMKGKSSFLAKAAHLVFDMDKMVGGQFEEGLAKLKAAVESAPQ